MRRTPLAQSLQAFTLRSIEDARRRAELEGSRPRRHPIQQAASPELQKPSMPNDEINLPARSCAHLCDEQLEYDCRRLLNRHHSNVVHAGHSGCRRKQQRRWRRPIEHAGDHLRINGYQPGVGSIERQSSRSADERDLRHARQRPSRSVVKGRRQSTVLHVARDHRPHRTCGQRRASSLHDE